MAEFRTTSGLVSATPYVRTASGLVQVDTLFRGTSGLIDGSGGQASPIAVTVAPDTAYGTGRQPTITTGIVMVGASGGTAPYTYAWALSDSFGDWSATSPTAATTAFRVEQAIENDPYTATWVCTVTDANGKTGTASVGAQAYRYGANDVPL